MTIVTIEGGRHVSYGGDAAKALLRADTVRMYWWAKREGVCVAEAKADVRSVRRHGVPVYPI